MKTKTTAATLEALNGRVAACYDAKTLAKAALAGMVETTKGYPEWFQMRRVVDYLQKQATKAEAAAAKLDQQV